MHQIGKREKAIKRIAGQKCPTVIKQFWSKRKMEQPLSAFSEADQKQLDADKVKSFYSWSINFQWFIFCDRSFGITVSPKFWPQRKIRLENEKYLRSHPELAQITSTAIDEILREQPADPISFLARFMTDPDLKGRVTKAVNTIGIS